MENLIHLHQKKMSGSVPLYPRPCHIHMYDLSKVRPLANLLPSACKKFPCCSKSASKYILTLKLKVSNDISEQNSHQCKECSFKAASKDSLSKHMDTKHSGNQFSCTDCHYITNSKQSLK